MKRKVYTFIIVITLIAGVAFVYAQECKVKNANNDGSYTITIGGVNFTALTQQQKREMLKQKQDLEAANKEIGKLKAEIQSEKNISKQYKEEIADLKVQIEIHQKYGKKMKDANEKCEEVVRSLGGGRKFYVDGGIGITTGDDTKPAFMLGAGYGIFRLWGFAQSGNWGALAGVSYPLF